MKLRLISDPGHGWLEVPMTEVDRLNIGHLISRYSYRWHANAYLEEDSDAAVFMKAKKSRDEPVDLVEVYQENTLIRNYPRFEHGFIEG